MSTDALGEGLRNGTVSMDEFMDTMVRLNEEGIFELCVPYAVAFYRDAFHFFTTGITCSS